MAVGSTKEAMHVFVLFSFTLRACKYGRRNTFSMRHDACASTEHHARSSLKTEQEQQQEQQDCQFL